MPLTLTSLRYEFDALVTVAAVCSESVRGPSCPNARRLRVHVQRARRVYHDEILALHAASEDGEGSDERRGDDGRDRLQRSGREAEELREVSRGAERSE